MLKVFFLACKEFMEVQGSSSNVSAALFLVLSQGSGYLEKTKVEKALESWKASDGLNAAGWGTSLFWAKAQISLAMPGSMA